MQINSCYNSTYKNQSFKGIKPTAKFLNELKQADAQDIFVAFNDKLKNSNTDIILDVYDKFTCLTSKIKYNNKELDGPTLHQKNFRFNSDNVLDVTPYFTKEEISNWLKKVAKYSKEVEFENNGVVKTIITTLKSRFSNLFQNFKGK